MTKACDYCHINGHYVCEGHCGACAEHARQEEVKEVGGSLKTWFEEKVDKQLGVALIAYADEILST